MLYGSGTAGTGIADQVCDAIAQETGRPKNEAAKQIWCLDKQGLLLKSQSDTLTPAQVPFARDDSEWNTKQNAPDLLSVMKMVKPHVLIGTSTKPKAFTEEVIREMGRHVERPIVFPLSNPTRLHEADPKDINEWTDGRALMATGSPFPPVERNGGQYEIGECYTLLHTSGLVGYLLSNTALIIAECNNSTCFPGIGLGAVLSRTRLLTDQMLVAAVKALAARSPALQDANRPLLPDVDEARSVSVDIAKAVIQTAVSEGHAEEDNIPTDDGELEEWIQVQMWNPEYRPLKKV